MTSGYKEKTLFKYLLYLYMVLCQRGFKPPFINVGLGDTNLEKQLSVSRKTLIQVLTQLGIIVRSTKSYAYHKINISYKYFINIDMYLECFNEIVATKDIIGFLKDFPADVPNTNIQSLVLLSKKICKTNWTILNKDQKILLTTKVNNLLNNTIICFFLGDSKYANISDVTMLTAAFDDNQPQFKIKKTTLDCIKNNTNNSLKPFVVHTKYNWTEDQEAYYINYYKKMLSETTIMQNLTQSVQEVRSHGIAVNCNIHVSLSKLKAGYKFKVSCRQYNPYCSLEKEIRTRSFTQEGITGNYDLHSAIFAVTRLMNTGAFEPDWDIKSEVLKLNPETIDGICLTKDDLKPLLMRMFFKKTDADAYNHYRYALLQDSESGLPNISKETFYNILDKCEKLTGGVKEYYHNIFELESIIELRSVKRIAKQNNTVRNIYDCFYFKPEEITQEEVKKIVKEEAAKLYAIMKMA